MFVPLSRSIGTSHLHSNWTSNGVPAKEPVRTMMSDDGIRVPPDTTGPTITILLGAVSDVRIITLYSDVFVPQLLVTFRVHVKDAFPQLSDSSIDEIFTVNCNVSGPVNASGGTPMHSQLNVAPNDVPEKLPESVIVSEGGIKLSPDGTGPLIVTLNGAVSSFTRIIA